MEDIDAYFGEAVALYDKIEAEFKNSLTAIANSKKNGGRIGVDVGRVVKETTNAIGDGIRAISRHKGRAYDAARNQYPTRNAWAWGRSSQFDSLLSGLRKMSAELNRVALDFDPVDSFHDRKERAMYQATNGTTRPQR